MTLILLCILFISLYPGLSVLLTFIEIYYYIHVMHIVLSLYINLIRQFIGYKDVVMILINLKGLNKIAADDTLFFFFFFFFCF